MLHGEQRGRHRFRYRLRIGDGQTANEKQTHACEKRLQSRFYITLRMWGGDVSLHREMPQLRRVETYDRESLRAS
jgi:hypothetical protein